MILFRKHSGRARLYSVAVADGAPRGLGRLLLAAAEDDAARRGASFLSLEVRKDNARAIDLYERNAYRATGNTPGYYADGMAALRYEKALAAETDLTAGTASS